MLVIQQNYGKEYEYIIFAFKTKLGFEAEIVCI